MTYFRQVAVMVVLMLSATLALAADAVTLRVGDPAPALATGKWIKGKPVEKFSKGTTYVVEFWATWCPPCRESIPHLSKLQQEYPDMVFIGQDCFEQDAAAVEPFVKEMGEKMKYRVAMDEPSGEQGKMVQTWMLAAGQTGIPTAFVISKDGKIAWIGHPMELDPVLKAVAAGTWGVEKAAKGQQVGDDIQQALRGRDLPKALSLIEAAIKEDPTLEKEYGATKVQVLVVQKQAPAAVAYATSLWKGALKDDGEALNEIAWTLVDPESGLKLTSDQLDAAGKIAASAVELTKGEDAAILDTQARVYATKGDFAKAIQIQTKAIEKASDPRMKADLQKTLAEYKSGAQEV